MLVTCKCHGIKIDRDKAYKVKIKDKNEYYCSLAEFVKMNEEKQSRLDILHTVDEIFGYTITNTALSKELVSLADIYTYKTISLYIQDKLSDLNRFMNKNFSSEYGKIRYFVTILKNNLKDYKHSTDHEIIKETSFEMVESKYKPKERKRSLNEYLEME